MKKLVAGGLAALALTAAAPASAQAARYLGAGEACRVAGGIIHSEFTNVVPGSSAGHCYTQRHPSRRNMRLVDIYYLDRSDRWWKTTVALRETWEDYRYRILSDVRVPYPN
jgi:hypothetical protein